MKRSFFAVAATAAVAALLAFAPADLAAARGGAGGGFGGGGTFRHGGFGGSHMMFRSGGFANRGMFRHRTFGGFRSSHSLRTASFHRMHGTHRPTLHSRFAMHSRMGLRHTRLSAASHNGLSTTPAGFSRGKAGWKQNGGTPPGWSHGNKTGWGCTAGSAGCMPPGLAKKNGTGIQPVGRPSPASTASRLNLTPASTRRPISGARAPSAGMKHPTVFHTQPVSHTRKLPTPSPQ